MKKRPTIAIPPKGRYDYLTVGKNYDIINLSKDYFTIIGDNGVKLYCIKSGCAHLGGKKWILK